MSDQSELPRLSLVAVSRRFGREVVLKELSLEVRPGEITALLGHNGSGKSTLLRICAGLCRPDSGAVQTSTPGARAPRVAFVGHQSALYAALTVKENLKLAALLQGLGDVVDSTLEEWQLRADASKRVGELSKGQQVRVALARAFLHDPDYIFLDEPTASFDERSTTVLLQKLVQQRSRKHAPVMLVATHDLSRVSPVIDRVVVLSSGSIVHDSAEAGEKSSALLQAIDFYRAVNR